MNVFVHHFLDFSDLVDFYRHLFRCRVSFSLLHHCIGRISNISSCFNLNHILILHYNQKWGRFPPLCWLPLWLMVNSASLTKTVRRLPKRQVLPLYAAQRLYTKKKVLKLWIALVLVWAFLLRVMISNTREWSQPKPSAIMLAVSCLHWLVQQ